MLKPRKLFLVFEFSVLSLHRFLRLFIWKLKTESLKKQGSYFSNMV